MKSPPPEDRYFEKPGCPACEFIFVLLLCFVSVCIGLALSVVLR